MDIKQVLALIESAEHPKQALAEGKSMSKDMAMQHYTKQEMKTPVKNPISKLNEYFKVVDNEMLDVIKEEHDAKRVAVKNVVDRVLSRLDENKKQNTVKPRNLVAKNAMATTSGAGAHKDKKKAEKQGDVKHKAKQFEQGVSEGSDFGEPKDILEDVLQTLEREVEWPLTEVMDPREVRQLLAPIIRAINSKLVSMDRVDEVTGAQKCWPGYKKVGTQPGTGKNASKPVNKCKKIGEDEEEKGRIKDKYKKIKEDIAVGSAVKVYSNVLKKAVFGTVVALKENKAYINYNNTKIVMVHLVETIQINEVGAIAGKIIPGLGLAAGGYDAYQRAKQGDYIGAGLSGAAGLASTLPGLGTAAATGLLGAQLGRDKARTGSFLPSYDEIGAAGKKGQAATAAPTSSGYTIQRGDTLTKIAKANNTTIKDIMAANPQITDPNKIAAGAKLTLPGQSAAAAAAVPKSGGAVDATRTTQKTTQVPPAEVPKQAATPAAQSTPDVSVGGASVTDRKVTQQPTAVTKQGNVTTTTSGSSASGTLKGITQDMIANHPIYKSEMAKVAGKDPMIVNMTRNAAAMKANDAIMKDPSYLQNYKAPAPKPTGNSRMDDF